MRPNPASPAAALPAGAPLDELLKTMDLVDQLRHESRATDALLQAGDDEAALVAQVRRTYTDQGIDVPEALIVRAVDALRERQFSFEAPADGWATRLAGVYVRRSAIARRLGKGLLATAGVLLVGLAVTQSWSALQERHRRSSWAALHGQAQSLIQERAAVGTTLAQLSTRIEALHDPLPAVQEHRTAAAALVQTGQDRLAAAPVRLGPEANLSVPTDTDAPLDVEQAPLLAILAEDRALLDGVQLLAQQADDEAKIAAQLTQLVGALARERGTGGVAAIVATPHAFTLTKTQSALETGQASVAGQILAQARAWRALGPALTAQAEQWAKWPASERAEAAPVVSVLTRALEEGQLAPAQTALGQFDALHAQLNQVYTLTISDRPDEKSGVRRKADDLKDAHSYYIVVDAKNLDGTPLELPITSVENNRITVTDHFAIRVAEAVYEQVKADKLDDGIIDNRNFGEKTAGTLTPTYRFPVQGGAITQW